MSDFFNGQLDIFEEEPQFGGRFIEEEQENYNQDLEIPFDEEEEVYSPPEVNVPQMERVPEEVPNNGINIQMEESGTAIVDEDWGCLMTFDPLPEQVAQSAPEPVQQLVVEEIFPSLPAPLAPLPVVQQFAQQLGAPLAPFPMAQQFPQQLVQQFGAPQPDYNFLQYEEHQPTYAIRHHHHPIPPHYVPSPPSPDDDIDTHQLASIIKSILAGLGISQTAFGRILLQRAQGTTSNYLKKPLPYREIGAAGRLSFQRMKHWKDLPVELQRLIMQKNMTHEQYSQMIGLQAVAITKKKMEKARMEAEGVVAEKRPPRILFADSEKQYLQEKFAQNPKPSREEMDSMAVEIGLPAPKVHNFFLNYRNRPQQ